jgi:drug/metabolite transporter (DMT)-like permease
MVPAICVGGFVTFIVAGVMGYVAGGHPGGGFPVSPQEMILLAFMGPLQLSIPLILYAKGAKHVPAVTLTLVVMLDVVLSPFWAWIGAGELPAKSAYIGGSIIILAVMVSILGDRWMRRANVGPT